MSQLRTANLLGALAGAVVARLDSHVSDHPNHTDTAAGALNLIAMHEGCSNQELSRALKLSHPATVRLVDKLEVAGLVQRKAGKDGRRVAFHLTAQGRTRARMILEERCIRLEGMVSLLSAKEQADLDAIAGRLLSALTLSPQEGAHICRLCDEIACPPSECPVHSKASALLKEAPAARRKA